MHCSSLAKHSIEYGNMKIQKQALSIAKEVGEGAGSCRVLCFGQVVLRD